MDIADQIEQAFIRDQEQNARPVTSREELPIAFEWITPEWLTDVLCRGHDGAKVNDFQLGGSSDGTSNRRAIAVQYNAAGEADPDLPRQIFCKAAHNLANRVVVGGIGCADNEANFYEHIRPHLAIEAPRCFYARVDRQTWNAMVILEDISEQVLEFCDHRTEVTKARAMSQISSLATLHGQCWSRPELAQVTQEKFLPWRTFFENTCKFGLKESSEQGFLMCDGIIPDRLLGRANEIWPATVLSFDDHEKEFQTLAHHDVHLRNWYLTKSDAMGLGDWQCAVRGHWGRDLAYTLSCGLTIENRRAWEQELIAFYLEELRVNGGPRVNADEAWRAYRRQMITAMTWWTITINPAPGMPDMQPLDATREFLARIGTAMDDVGTLDAFRA
jgi:hypothetical protein